MGYAHFDRGTEKKQNMQLSEAEIKLCGNNLQTNASELGSLHSPPSPRKNVRNLVPKEMITNDITHISSMYSTAVWPRSELKIVLNRTFEDLM